MTCDHSAAEALLKEMIIGRLWTELEAAGLLSVKPVVKIEP